MTEAQVASNPLAQLDAIIDSRRTAAPDRSYVALLLQKGPDSFLKKIGEEATEVVMAAKDVEAANTPERKTRLVGEVADLWFHAMVALAYYGLNSTDVVNELTRREGLSGIDEKALRKAQLRAQATTGLNT